MTPGRGRQEVGSGPGRPGQRKAGFTRGLDRADEPVTIWGEHHVLDVVSFSPGLVQKVYVDVRCGDLGRRIESMARDFEVIPAEGDRLREIAGDEARQAVAVMRVPRALGLEAWLAGLPKVATCVALDGVTDPGNLGAILRSGAFFGAAGCLVCRDNTAPLNSIVARRSAGALFRLPVVEVVNLSRSLGVLKEAGFWVYSTLPASGRELFEERFPDRTCFVLGDEGRGIRPNVAAHCDASIRLCGGFESLNVSVFTAVALYERFRQARGEGEKTS